MKETASLFLSRRLDRIRVVGIEEPVQIHEVLETMEHAPDALHQKVDLFHKALDLFNSRRWNDAGKLFYQIYKQFPGDGPSVFYFNRCKEYLKNEPLPDWDGVFNMAEK
jgi:adenylate cyclase